MQHLQQCNTNGKEAGHKNTIHFLISCTMKNIICAILLVFYWVGGFAQVNLVRNPSFEKYYPHCPYYPDHIKLATGWSCIDTNGTDGLADSFYFCNAKCTPEYMNKCTSSPVCSVPANSTTYQYPRTGNGYASMCIYTDSNTATISTYQRDYVLGRLYQPLTAGQSYCVTFYVNMANGSAFTVNHIGAYLDDGSIDTNSNCGLPHTQYTPQVYELDMISDTLGWTKIQGSFTAIGNERFITIGNYFSRVATDTIWRYPVSGGGHGACSYYEVDDVSVIASGPPAYAGWDTTINWGDSTYIGIDSNGDGMPCLWYLLGDTARSTAIDSGGRILVHPLLTTTYVVVMDLCGTITSDTVVVTVRPVGLENGGRGAVKRLVHVWPNPATNVVHVEGAEGCEVAVYDMVGQLCKVYCNGEPSRTMTVDFAHLPKGVYCVAITDPVSGERVVKRVVKN